VVLARARENGAGTKKDERKTNALNEWKIREKGERNASRPCCNAAYAGMLARSVLNAR